MREARTDERPDDLAKRMDDGFREVREEQRPSRAETNARFDAMQRMILRVGAGLFGTIVIGFIGLIVTGS